MILSHDDFERELPVKVTAQTEIQGVQKFA